MVVVDRAKEVRIGWAIRQVATRAQIGLLWQAGEPFEARGGGGAGALETGGPTRRRGLARCSTSQWRACARRSRLDRVVAVARQACHGEDGLKPGLDGSRTSCASRSLSDPSESSGQQFWPAQSQEQFRVQHSWRVDEAGSAPLGAI